MAANGRLVGARMIVHLIKMAVGVEDPAHLARLQQGRLARARAAAKGPAKLVHMTRNRPRRGDALLAGGSIYWVIRGWVRLRQRIIGLDEGTREDGRPACMLVLDPELIATHPLAARPFQGWRYLEAAKAPKDAGRQEPVSGAPGKASGIPSDMVMELKELGLL